MTNVNPKSQKEETSAAPQRSSSVGKVFSRLFSKSPDVHPVPLMDPNELHSQVPTRFAGSRGRSPPINSVTTIRVDNQQLAGPPETHSTSPQQHTLPQSGGSRFGRVFLQSGVIRSTPPTMPWLCRIEAKAATLVKAGFRTSEICATRSRAIAKTLQRRVPFQKVR